MGITHGKFGNLYKWNGTAANLTTEACTVTSNSAQITDTTKRILNPNATLTVTPTNSVNLLSIDYANGTAHFDGAPGVTTISGTNAYVPTANLAKTAQLFEWSIEVAIEAHDITDFQDAWKAFAGGLAEASGQAQGFIAGINWWDDLEDETDGTMAYWFLRLFSYDPDDDGTGDHWDLWTSFEAFAVGVPIGEYIKETIRFKSIGRPCFTANA